LVEVLALLQAQPHRIFLYRYVLNVMIASDPG